MNSTMSYISTSPAYVANIPGRVWAFVVSLFMAAFGRVWLVLDSCLYYIMRVILVVLSFADALLAFSDRAVQNYELAKKVFKLSMYNSIN